MSGADFNSQVQDIYLWQEAAMFQMLTNLGPCESRSRDISNVSRALQLFISMAQMARFLCPPNGLLSTR